MYPATLSSSRTSIRSVLIVLLTIVIGAFTALAWSAQASAQTTGNPQAQDVMEVTAPEEVTVIDMAEELSDDDEIALQADTYSLSFPEQVKAVRYIVFDDNDDNLNDTVENYLRAEHPDWITENAFTPGELIVAVGMDPHRNGVYCGNDVCSAIDFYGEGRQDGILEQMVSPLQDGRIAIGLYEGAAAAANPDVRQIDEPTPGWVKGLVIAIIGAILAGAASIIAFFSRKSMKDKAAAARERFDRVQREYGESATRLDAINVRAHSLTSPLANDSLREQWDDVRTRFLSLNDAFSTPPISTLTHDSSDKEFRKAAGALEEADITVTQMETAEKNIDTLYEMEHGDADTRRRELTSLRKDISEARVEINDKDSVLDEILTDLIARIDEADIADPEFMNFYARLLDDYSTALDGVASHMKDVEETTERTAPTIYDSNWRPGTGYNAFVPYYMISTWHAADVSAAQAASSSSANTSFSSGFSGGGASGSW